MLQGKLPALLLAALTAASAGAPTPEELDAAQRALPEYLAKSDPSYEWRVRGRYRVRGADIVELLVTSQTWRGAPWKHQLVLINPGHVVRPTHGLLIVGGGRWRDSYETDPPLAELDGAELFIAIARRLDTVVAILGQVPFQPLFDRREDRLIAYTFERYLESGDPEWPLLLPMVKSAIRAMDASSAAAAAEWGTPLDTFTVLGGSKRGWTAWLAAAADSRVTAVAPVVIDALNMRRHFPHQTEFWGRPSEEIRSYTDLGLDRVLGSDDGAALRRIVDPFEYRASITQPKLVVLATNDAYFPVDSANLYWDGLVGPKYLLYLPNDEHSISDYRRLVPTLRALHSSVDGGAALPRLEWEYRFGSDTGTLCVRSVPAPSRLRVWHSVSAAGDFRDAVWEAVEERRGAPAYEIPLGRPAAGYAGVFAEAVYGRGRSAFSLSTNLALLAPPGVLEIGERPAGTSGVCTGAVRQGLSTSAGPTGTQRP